MEAHIAIRPTHTPCKFNFQKARPSFGVDRGAVAMSSFVNILLHVEIGVQLKAGVYLWFCVYMRCRFYRRAQGEAGILTVLVWAYRAMAALF